jgi:type I restriction enzyme S subunit
VKLVPLGKIAKVDRVAATADECEFLPYVGLDDIEKDRGGFADEFRPKPEKLLAAKFKFSPRHVLYGKLRPYLNKVALPHFVGVCTTEILPLLPNEKVLEPGYLFALLLSPKFVAWASQNMSGANLPRLDPKLLVDYEIRLPPLSEQKRIAAILEKADRLRRTRRYAHELSGTFLQSVFLEMFGNFLITDENEVLKNVLALPLSNGSFESNELYGSGVPVIWVDNLYHTITIDLSHLRRARLSEAAIQKYEVVKDDLLFTRSSLVREGVGQINIVPKLPERTAFECHIIRARVDQNKVNPFYVLGLYRTPYGRSFIMRRANTATMTTISQTSIEELPCPIPPLPLQEKFSAIVRRFERLRAQQREAERQAEHLFQTLLHRAFSCGL